MKITLTAIILALATFSLAQTAAPTKPNDTQATPAAGKADCPCCQKMAEGKAAESCCAHHQDASASSEGSCCEHKDGNEAMSCTKGDKDRSADACCANGKCAEGKDGCCAKSNKTTEQAALACCGASADQCGTAHHEHADINK